MTTALLQIKHAQCQRAGELLFAPVSWAMKSGELAIIAGPNGSGKTTLLEALSGLSFLSKGSRIYLDSEALQPWLKDSHYVGHKLGNKGNLSCLENLQFVANINDVKVSENQISAVLEQAGLAGYEFQHANDLSAGQKKRLALSRLLMLKKTYWLLDEPFVNLDYAGCDWLYTIIQQHVLKGGCVILTAHDQKKIHDLANHQVILDYPEEVYES